MIFRDDDINHLTDLDKFKRVHEIFIQHEVKHTIAVIAKDIDKAPVLVQYIRDNIELFDVQLHCWEHVELPNLTSNELKYHLAEGVIKLKEVFGVKPTTLYPPWNKSDDKVKSCAAMCGLTVSNEKVSLSQYVRVRGSVKENVVNFHYWSEEVMMLDAALVLHNERKNKCS